MGVDKLRMRPEFNQRSVGDLSNERLPGVVGVLHQLGRRKDPLSLRPPQCLWPLRSRLSTEHLKPSSTRVSHRQPAQEREQNLSFPRANSWPIRCSWWMKHEDVENSFGLFNMSVPKKSSWYHDVLLSYPPGRALNDHRLRLCDCQYALKPKAWQHYSGAIKQVGVLWYHYFPVLGVVIGCQKKPLRFCQIPCSKPANLILMLVLTQTEFGGGGCKRSTTVSV